VKRPSPLSLETLTPYPSPCAQGEGVPTSR